MGVDNFLEVGGAEHPHTHVSGHAYFMTLRMHKMHHDSMPWVLLIIGLFNETCRTSFSLSFPFVSHIKHYSNILILYLSKIWGALTPSAPLLSTSL